MKNKNQQINKKRKGKGNEEATEGILGLGIKESTAFLSSSSLLFSFEGGPRTSASNRQFVFI